MAYAVETRTHNPATMLREELDKAERLAVILDGQNIVEFLETLDRIDQMFAELSQTMDLRPESARWQSLLNRLTSKPGTVVSAARKAGGLARLRAQHPPATGLWWHLDAELARRRRTALKRIALTLAAIVVIAGGVIWGLNTFFPPDPNTVLLVDTTSQVQQLVMNQQWEEALQVVKEAQQTLPDEPELLIWESVLAHHLGREEQAQQALARAQERLADQPVQFWLAVGNTRLQAGDLEGAAQAAQQIMAMDPNEPQGYFLMGSVAEAQGDVPTAIQMFDRTSTLAAEQGNPQLEVIAKVRMGNLLQRAVALPTPAGELTNTQTITP
ncbi:MAG: hypothetical protein KatS3mg050_1228 [Litorilinea sp.]|nr:MAG: hypothetical protein KatS3mg050_1228 [Litorilinea sp.]